MAIEHTVDTLNEKLDLLDRFYAERHAAQLEAVRKAFDAAQLAVQHAREVTDAKISSLSANQGDALKWMAGIIAGALIALAGHYWK